MKHKHRRRTFWVIFLWSQLQLVLGEDVAPTNFTQPINGGSPDLRNIFSPRMDYEQWKPLGRGDPLKNDPTYDYVPPVLDRVHYWIDPALRKPDPPVPGDSQKTEILLLGVSSKKPSTGTSVADSRKDTYDSFFKFVDGPQFNNQRVSRPQQSVGSSYFLSNYYPKTKGSYSKGNDQRMPYTMLMPPPLVTKKPPLIMKQTTSAPVTTTISPLNLTTPASPAHNQVTVQASNLVFQSSSYGNWKETETSTILTPNPVSYPTKKLKPFKEDVVFHKHMHLPDSFRPVQFSSRRNLTNSFLTQANSDHSISYVTAPPFIDQEIMHRGEVSDDNLDISNTYVKIGKTEAQVHSTAIDNMSDMLIHPPNMMLPPSQTPITLQTLQTMQTMQPPQVSTSPVYKKPTNPVLQVLEKEKIEEPTTESMTTVPPTTISSSLTTDPLFKHYKQPVEPIKEPLYLIIQGHSKVKTYGPSKQFHGIKIQETNEILDDREEVEVKHLHHYMKRNEDMSPRKGRSGNLQTLKHVIQTGLGAIDFGDVPENRRKDEVKETELEFGYKVGGDTTSEKYYKGIVEEARKLRVEA